MEGVTKLPLKPQGRVETDGAVWRQNKQGGRVETESRIARGPRGDQVKDLKGAVWRPSQGSQGGRVETKSRIVRCTAGVSYASDAYPRHLVMAVTDGHLVRLLRHAPGKKSCATAPPSTPSACARTTPRN
eukprot:2831330-Rhodomonas_salina.3